jgi:hypothetical protein
MRGQSTEVWLIRARIAARKVYGLENGSELERPWTCAGVARQCEGPSDVVLEAPVALARGCD